MVTVSNPHNGAGVSQTDTVKASGGHSFKHKKSITCLHGVRVVLSMCLEECLLCPPGQELRPC